MAVSVTSIGGGGLTQEQAAQLNYIYFSTLAKNTSWANGSWDDIATILDAHYQGIIDITNIWNVGDTRTVSLSAMELTGVGESHAAQDVELILMSANHYNLTSSQQTSLGTSKTKAAFVFQQRYCLKNKGYMNGSNTTSTGWDGSARRTWCNSVYKTALPADLQNILKQVEIVTATAGTWSTKKTSDDYIFLPAEKEVFGSNTYANSTAEDNLKQYTWYATSGNSKSKNVNSSASGWWERSPSSGNSAYFCFVSSAGGADNTNASISYGLAPCGCI